MKTKLYAIVDDARRISGEVTVRIPLPQELVQLRGQVDLSDPATVAELLALFPGGRVGDRVDCEIIARIRGWRRRYGVSDLGNFYNNAKWPPKKLKVEGTERLAITLSDKRGQKKLRLPRVVTESFYGPAPSRKHFARHLDGNHGNNSAPNLDWATQDQIAQDKAAMGVCVGPEHPRATLTSSDVEYIRASGAPYAVLASELGVPISTIANVKKGKTYTSGRERVPPNFPRWKPFENATIRDIMVEGTPKGTVEWVATLVRTK